MTNPPKRKGTAFETDCVRFFNEHGHPTVERRAQTGTRDRGDLSGLAGWVAELKNCRTLDLASWMKEAQQEAMNAGVHRYVVVHKRRGKNVRDAYATLPLWLFAALLNDLSPLEAPA